MQELYYIDTENRHGHFIIFESFEEAAGWMKRATRLNGEQIRAQIFKAEKTALGHYNIWPRCVIGGRAEK